MRNSEWSKLVSVSGRIVLAFLFVCSQSAWAGQDPKANNSTKPSQKPAVQQTSDKPSPAATTARTETEESQTEKAEKSFMEERPTGNGSHEGIKVHGHWTIEVRNPDGTLVTHREFENSFAGAGAYPLTTVLARANAVGGWLISLSGGPSAGACPGSGVGLSSGDCVIEDSANTITGTGIFHTLAVTTPTNTAGLNTLQLAGTATAGGAGQISIVNTIINVCPGGTGCEPAVSGIYVSAGYLFTQAGITAIPISSGQTIAVTVNISFS
jgi:hypothetical protein